MVSANSRSTTASGSCGGLTAIPTAKDMATYTVTDATAMSDIRNSTADGIYQELPKGTMDLKEVSSNPFVAPYKQPFIFDPTILSKASALIIVLSVICGLYFDCVEWNYQPAGAVGGAGDAAAAAGASPAGWRFKFLFWKFSFYTVQSNSIIGILHLFNLVRNSHSVSEIWMTIKSCALMMISITMIVWHLILAKSINLNNYSGWKPLWGSHIFHTIVPLMCWFDWVVIDKIKSSYHASYQPTCQRIKLKKRILPLFLICPLGYLTFSILRAQFGQPYGINQFTGKPFWHWYPFIETTNPITIYPGADLFEIKNPHLIVFLNCLVIVLAVIIGGFIFIIIDGGAAEWSRFCRATLWRAQKENVEKEKSIPRD